MSNVKLVIPKKIAFEPDPVPIFKKVFFQVQELAKLTHLKDVVITAATVSHYLYGNMSKSNIEKINEALEIMCKKNIIKKAGLKDHYIVSKEDFLYDEYFEWISPEEFHAINDNLADVYGQKVLTYYLAMVESMYYDQYVKERTFGHREQKYFMDLLGITKNTCSRYLASLVKLKLIYVVRPYKIGDYSYKSNFYAKTQYKWKLNKYIEEGGYKYEVRDYCDGESTEDDEQTSTCEDGVDNDANNFLCDDDSEDLFY